MKRNGIVAQAVRLQEDSGDEMFSEPESNKVSHQDELDSEIKSNIDSEDEQWKSLEEHSYEKEYPELQYL